MGCDIAKLGNEGPCEDFIYPILNWEDKPLDAFALVGAGVVIGMPVLQTVLWSLYKLRISIRKSCFESESRGDKMTLECSQMEISIQLSNMRYCVFAKLF